MLGSLWMRVTLFILRFFQFALCYHLKIILLLLYFRHLLTVIASWYAAHVGTMIGLAMPGVVVTKVLLIVYEVAGIAPRGSRCRVHPLS